MGDCSHCGECCKWIVFGRLGNFDKKSVQYFLAHGGKVEQGFILIPSICKHLVKSVKWGSGGSAYESLCGIQETKPDICKSYNGKRYENRHYFWVPKNCTMAKP